MNKSWQTTIGGAFSALGTTLMGIGVVPQLGGTSNKTLTGIAMAGFICTAIGQFLAHLFAADARQLASLQRQMLQVPAAIQTGDTGRLFRTEQQQIENEKNPDPKPTNDIVKE